MNRICYSSWTKLRTLSLTRFKGPSLKVTKFNSIRFCSTNPNQNGCASQVDDDENEDVLARAEEEKKDLPLQKQHAPKKSAESITDRILRLSMQSPEEFTPTENADLNRINKFADAPFPDQKSRRVVRNPFQKGQRPDYDAFNNCTQNDGEGEDDDDFGNVGNYQNNRGQFQRYNSGLPRNQFDHGKVYSRRPSYNNRQTRRFNDDDDEDGPPSYNRRPSYNNNRQTRRFNDDDEDGPSFNRQPSYNNRQTRRFNDDDDEDGPSFNRRPSYNNNRQTGRFNDDDEDGPSFNRRPSYNNRQTRRFNDDDDEDEPSFTRRPSYNNRQTQRRSNDDESEGVPERRHTGGIGGRRQTMKDDMDDGDDDFDFEKEAKRSSPSTFGNIDNMRAIKDAYAKRFPSDGKREFHSYAPGRAQSLPDLKNIAATNEDPDVFGNLGKTKSHPADDMESPHRIAIVDKLSDEPELDDVVFRPEHRWNIRRLNAEVQDLLEKKRLIEALDLFTNTLAEGGFHFHLGELQYLYRILINECAQHGHVKMAFRLFSQMKRRKIVPEDYMFTSLFNACANSPWDAEANIDRMRRLRMSMERKGYLANKPNYHAMIKAYGRCGDIESAFGVVDEMTTRGINFLNATTTTFCFLLQACISNKENGFRHALFTVDKLRKIGLRLNLYGYNLLLRATRECGVSIPEDLQVQVKKRLAKLKALKSSQSQDESVPTIYSETPYTLQTKRLIAPHDFDYKSSLELIDSKSSVLKATSTELSDMELDALTYFKYPEYRLSALGGLSGVLEQMNKDRVMPDLKTVTELVQIVSPLNINDFMRILSQYQIEPDIIFFNSMIKTFNKHDQPKEARSVLNLFNEYHITPDIYTWGCLALGCCNWNQARNLLANMSDCHFNPNSEILGTLLSKACESYRPLYVASLLKELEKREIKPTQKDIERLENLKTTVDAAIVQMEKGQEIVGPLNLKKALLENTEEFLQHWVYFKLKYSYFRKAEIDIQPIDPWEEDYRTRIEQHKNRQQQIYADF